MPKSNIYKKSLISRFSDLPVKWIIKVAKLGLILSLSILIYRQVSTHIESYDIVALVWDNTYAKVLCLVVILLMGTNWFLEARKWRLLLSQFVSVNKVTAMQSVLSGISLAILTPGRIGEYGGRLLGIPNVHKGKALLANGVSSIAQNVANITIGLLGTVAYSFVFLGVDNNSMVALLSISCLFLIGLFGLYFRLDLIEAFLKKYQRIHLVKYILRHSSFLSTYSNNKLFKILGLSFVRYGVYTLQYVILVMICGVTGNPLHAFLGVSVIFFLQSGLPLPPMLSILARGEMAIWVWSVFTANIMGILTATFLLWGINLVIPAIVGAIIIWRTDLVNPSLLDK